MFLQENGYSEKCIKYYSVCWNGLIRYADSMMIDTVSEDLCGSYLNSIGISTSDTKSNNSKKYIRGIALLVSFVNNNEIAANMQRVPLAPQPYVEVATAYINHLHFLGQTRASIKSKRSRVKRFLDFIYDTGVQSLKGVSKEDIIRFMSHLAASHSSTGRGNILYSVKDFLVFCKDEGFLETDLSVLIKGIYTNPNETLPSTYTQNEIALLLESVDRTTLFGKKCYAVLVLTALLGIRASDIISITLEDIKWEEGIIEFFQKKTGKPVLLPLIDSVKYALLDYLQNSRPNTEHKHLFVRDRAPVAPYKVSSIIYNLVSDQLTAAGLSTDGRHRGPHSLRHSLADSLLKEETPLPVIASALGHSNTKNTSRYLRIDIGQLRQVALEVSI
jgi:integrase